MPGLFSSRNSASAVHGQEHTGDVPGGYDPVEAPERFRLTLAERSPNVASTVILSLLGEIAHQHTLLARQRWSEQDMERFSEIGHQKRSDLVDLIEAGDATARRREYIIAGERVVGRELLETRVDVLGGATATAAIQSQRRPEGHSGA